MSARPRNWSWSAPTRGRGERLSRCPGAATAAGPGGTAHARGPGGGDGLRRRHPPAPARPRGPGLAPAPAPGAADLALLLNRVDGQRLLPGANGHGGHGVGGLCVLWSDPPASRQLRLARLILPGIQRIGVLYGKDSEFLLDELRREARSQGLQLFVASSSGNDDPRPLQFLLGNSDLLLGIDDKQLYNSQSIKSLLLGSYARTARCSAPPQPSSRPAAWRAATATRRIGWTPSTNCSARRPGTGPSASIQGISRCSAIGR